MNIGIVIAICTVILGAIPIYYLAKSNARENERLKQEGIAASVAAAVAPVQRALDEEKAKNVRLIARNEQLEDQLYGRHR